MKQSPLLEILLDAAFHGCIDISCIDSDASEFFKVPLAYCSTFQGNCCYLPLSVFLEESEIFVKTFSEVRASQQNNKVWVYGDL